MSCNLIFFLLSYYGIVGYNDMILFYLYRLGYHLLKCKIGTRINSMSLCIQGLIHRI